MKHFLFLTLACTFLTLAPHDSSYINIVTQQATEWKNSYIEILQNKHHLQTFMDIILLSYQIAKESCTMLSTKLLAQEELLKIYTPSLNDSWCANMQVVNNDMQALEQALANIKESQATFQLLFEKLKKIAPEIIQINPQPTQTLIHDLKSSLMLWGKEQHNIPEELSKIQQEFSSAISNIADIKIMFNALDNIAEFKNYHLKEAAGYVAKTNKDIETIFSHVIQMRKAKISCIQNFFSCFFKTYYTMLYELCSKEDQIMLNCITTQNQKLPHPDAFFI